MVGVDVRGKRLSRFSDEATLFTSSMEFDGPIAKHVVSINMAHTLMLYEAGYVDRSKASRILSALLEVGEKPAVSRPVEDIHDAVEQFVVDRCGVEVAGYMNWGKSRNDQVATALRMAVRERLVELSRAIQGVQAALLGLAKEHAATVFPAYTHLQRAQLVTFGHQLLAYFDSLQRCQERVREAYGRVDVCPMGSAALAGSYLTLDWGRLARLLGFSRVVSNSVDGVSSRDFVVEAISTCLFVMLELSRMAEELVLWSTREFGLVEIGDEYAASSSIMPQKKNPVVAETIRAKASTVLGLLVGAASTLKALPYTYNLDFQEATRALWPAFDHTVASAHMMGGMLGSLKLRPEGVGGVVGDDVFGAAALAHRLTELGGVSFRQAHMVVGRLVRLAEEQGVSLSESVKRNLQAVCVEVLGRVVDVDVGALASTLSPDGLVGMVSPPFGANPKYVVGEAGRRDVFLVENERWVSSVSASIAESEAQLLKQVKRVLNGGENV